MEKDLLFGLGETGLNKAVNRFVHGRWISGCTGRSSELLKPCLAWLQWGCVGEVRLALLVTTPHVINLHVLLLAFKVDRNFNDLNYFLPF